LLAAPLGEVRAEQNPPTAGVVAPAAGPDEKTQIARFAQALELLRSNYNGPVDVDSLTSAALKGMAGSLDGHSTYMTAEEYK
ncbi:hypothetical protein ABTL04_20875, partial [Acinetobacter baumannii]